MVSDTTPGRSTFDITLGSTHELAETNIVGGNQLDARVSKSEEDVGEAIQGDLKIKTGIEAGEADDEGTSTWKGNEKKQRRTPRNGIVTC